MTISSDKAVDKIKQLLTGDNLNAFINNISPVSTDQKSLPPQVPHLKSLKQEAIQKRISLLKEQNKWQPDYLVRELADYNPEDLKGNIENFIGFTAVPTGVVGPLRINGTAARGDFYIPFATSEGALIASYSRGAYLASLAGGVSSICLSEGVQRTPTFKFKNFAELSEFIVWLMPEINHFKDIVKLHTSHGSLIDSKINIDGNQLTLIFDFNTADAAGQNMVTICTDAICRYIIENTPVKPDYWLVEGNLSGDKKASAVSLTSVRGKKVTAEVLIPGSLLEKHWKISPDKICSAWQTAIVNGIQSGSIGVNFHFSNCIAAIFLACGQDVATVSEAAVGTTRFEVNNDRDLYACVTLPNLIVGTVGGGTILPTMNECLKLLDCAGTGKGIKFAEICAAAALCGELSICASIASGDFARAHSLFGRKKK
jgi:hydroxymethylglutaryl-CoA reductase (NADPH)